VAKKRKSKSKRSKQVGQSKRPKQVGFASRSGTPKIYPSPAERERIIGQRDKLLQELISIFVQTSGGGKSPDPAIARLAQTYGLDEVLLVMNKFQQTSTSRELIGEEAFLYRLYRQTFARYGGNRPFLNKQAYEELIVEHGKLVATRQLKSFIPFLAKRSAREQELHDLLLVGVDYWEDITPPSAPPRPIDFDPPPNGTYDHPAQTLLEWGWKDNEERLATNAKNTGKWRPVIPELVQMVFDEGLLAGWPAEAASWGPYHALQMLGRLQAHEVAERLLTLLDRENDWLSDRLPLVWSQMGPAAEAPLWAYVAERNHDPQKRSLVLRGLSRIAEAHPHCRLEIINRLAGLLQHSPADDATSNGYLVHVLYRMQAVEAREAILDAFEQGKVDLSIMQPQDVDFLHDR
jgi:hypothetical protein